MNPGEYILRPEPVMANVGRETVEVAVANHGDRPIQVGSHVHFFEVNKALVFPRAAAFGMHLNIPAGTAVRFEPGDRKAGVPGRLWWHAARCMASITSVTVRSPTNGATKRWLAPSAMVSETSRRENNDEPCLSSGGPTRRCTALRRATVFGWPTPNCLSRWKMTSQRTGTRSNSAAARCCVMAWGNHPKPGRTRRRICSSPTP